MKTMLTVFLVLFLLAVTCTGTLEAKNVEPTREFSELKCRITLPSSRCRWIDEKRFPDAIAAFKDETGAKLVLSIMEKGKRLPKDLNAGTEYEQKLLESRKLAISSSIWITFRDVKCYEFHAFSETGRSIWTGRLFAANGHLYHLEVIDSRLPVKDRDRLEPMFEAFEFIGTPEQPAEEKASPYALSHKAGRIAGYALIGAVVLGIFKVIRGRS